VRRPVFLALLGATLLTASAAAAQASDPLRALRPDPQDSVHVDAFLGVDYTILNRNASAHEVRGFSLQPYLLKTADFSVSNLSRFDFGLNAAATSLLAIGGFAKPDDTPTSDSDAAEAERYAGMIAYRFGGFKIRTEVGFARMATYLTPGAQNGTAYPRSRPRCGS
jgi:hypothetical protein